MLGCPTFPNTTDFTLDQQAVTDPFSTGATCTPPITGTFRPSNSVASMTPLTDLNGRASGPWAMTFDDGGVGGDNTFNGWGLRITHAPLTITASAAASQPLGKTLTFKASCNANCDLTTGGDASAQTFKLVADHSESLEAPVSAAARARLLPAGGVATLALTATDDIGDTTTRTISVPVTSKAKTKVKVKKKKKKKKKKKEAEEEGQEEVAGRPA